MTPCEGRDPTELGPARARISEELEKLLDSDATATFVISVTLNEAVGAEQLARWGLVQAPDEFIGALPRERVLALAERDEVTCIKVAREMQVLDPGDSPREDLWASGKLDAGLAGALAIDQEGPYKVIVTFSGTVDADGLKQLGLAETGPLPGGGVQASGFVDRAALQELIENQDVQSIGSVPQRRFRRPRG